MEHYERILPGMANRILSMAEGNARNRWRNDRARRVVAMMGPVFAFIVGMTLISGGIYLTINGQSTAGLFTIAGTVAAIVWAFRRATKQRASDLK